LGGQSLYAALAASRLRALPQLAHLSVSDIYRYPTVATLAQAIDGRRPRRARPFADGMGQKVHPVSRLRHRVGGLVQAAGVYGLLLLAFYPLLVLAMQAQGRTLSLGARVGANCYLNTGFLLAYDLLTIGDDTSINLDAHLLGYTVEDGMLIIGPIHIGRDCFVGTHSVIAPGAMLADGAQLGEHSMVS